MKRPFFLPLVARRLPHRALLVCATALFGALPFAAASDLIGVYAFVDKVVFEPSDAAPERIQVWGGFALAQGGGNEYAPAKRGYLYYKLPPGGEKAALREWNDLKSMAGKDQLVGFGSRYGQKATVRAEGTKVEKPDVYSVDIGLTKVKPRDGYAPHNDLMKLRGAQKPARAEGT